MHVRASVSPLDRLIAKKKPLAEDTSAFSKRTFIIDTILHLNRYEESGYSTVSSTTTLSRPL